MSQPTRQELEEALAKTGIAEFMVQEETLPAHVAVVRAAARAWVDQEITDNMVKRAKLAAMTIEREPGMTLTAFNDAKIRAALEAALTRSDPE